MTGPEDASGPGAARDAGIPIEDRPVRLRKTVEIAAFLPILGVVLFMPPVIDLANREALILGLPAPVLYIFAVWGALILAAGLLARRIAREAADGDDPREPR